MGEDDRTHKRKVHTETKPNPIEKIVRRLAYHGTTLTTEGMVENAIEELTAELQKAREGYVKITDQKCYNCGNFTVAIDDRARCPFCACHEALQGDK